MAKLGIQSHWIKHIGFTDKGLLKVLIFAEHAEKIGEALEKAGSSVIAVVEDPELYPEDATLLKKLIKRMERGVLRLHKDAHCTRREMTRIKQTALGKLAAAKGAAQMVAKEPEGQLSRWPPGMRPALPTRISTRSSARRGWCWILCLCARHEPEQLCEPQARNSLSGALNHANQSRRQRGEQEGAGTATV